MDISTLPRDRVLAELFLLKDRLSRRNICNFFSWPFIVPQLSGPSNSMICFADGVDRGRK